MHDASFVLRPAFCVFRPLLYVPLPMVNMFQELPQRLKSSDQEGIANDRSKADRQETGNVVPVIQYDRSNEGCSYTCLDSVRCVALREILHRDTLPLRETEARHSDT